MSVSILRLPVPELVPGVSPFGGKKRTLDYLFFWQDEHSKVSFFIKKKDKLLRRINTEEEKDLTRMRKISHHI